MFGVNEESAPIQGPASKKRRRVVIVDKRRRTVLPAPAHVIAAKDRLPLDQSTQESKYGADEKPQLAGLPISELHTKTAASQNSASSSQSRPEQFSERKAVLCKGFSEEVFSEIIVSPAETSCKDAWTRLIAWKDRQVINDGRYKSLYAQCGKSRWHERTPILRCKCSGVTKGSRKNPVCTLTVCAFIEKVQAKGYAIDAQEGADTDGLQRYKYNVVTSGTCQAPEANPEKPKPTDHSLPLVYATAIKAGLSNKELVTKAN